MPEPLPIIEPFRIKMVEPLPRSTPEQRAAWLAQAHHNPFLLRGGQITIDLLTDSGTGAMSAAQWAAMMTGDETYAGSESFFELQRVVRELTGLEQVIPTHQGRSAEHILFAALDVRDKVVLANSHFDTTRANVEVLGGEAIDLVADIARDPEAEHPFKGNIDLTRLEAALQEHGPRVALVLMTVTNNTGGGQPVSLANLRAAAELAHRYGKPFMLDAARFAENAWFIRMREPGQGHRSPRAIAQEMFRLSDGLTMSAKKDGLVNIGGLLCLKDADLAAQARSLLILTEGFPTYGGLAGRDLAALAVGLEEVLDEDYLRYRIASIRYLFELLDQAGVPMMRPYGGHAVYLDAARFHPHVPPEQFPGVSLCNQLYLEGGVRAVEIGSLMFGKPGGRETNDLELVRMTFPRRTYTQSHVDYLAAIVRRAFARRAEVPGYRILWQAPVLRAFTAQLDPLPVGIAC